MGHKTSSNNYKHDSRTIPFNSPQVNIRAWASNSRCVGIPVIYSGGGWTSGPGYLVSSSYMIGSGCIFVYALALDIVYKMGILYRLPLVCEIYIRVCCEIGYRFDPCLIVREIDRRFARSRNLKAFSYLTNVRRVGILMLTTCDTLYIMYTIV